LWLARGAGSAFWECNTVKQLNYERTKEKTINNNSVVMTKTLKWAKTVAGNLLQQPGVSPESVWHRSQLGYLWLARGAGSAILG
jgi:hypothetical protein